MYGARGTHADLSGLLLAGDTTSVATSQAIAGVFAMFAAFTNEGVVFPCPMGNLRPAQPLLINWLEREAMDTVQYGVLAHAHPAVSTGTCRPSRVGKRPRMRYFNVV